MRTWWPSALAACALLLVVATALATTARPKEVECPVCDHDFTAWKCGSYNSFGGADFDLCSHSRGGPPHQYWVWVCPSCRYANWEGDFAEGVSEATERRIREGLDAGFEITKDLEQSQIPTWAKYELLEQVLEQEGKGVSARAHALLFAAWSPRMESHDDLRAVWDDPELKPHWDAAWKRARELGEAIQDVGDDSLSWTRRELTVARARVAEDDVEPLSLTAQVHLLQAAFALRNRGENRAAQPTLLLLTTGETRHATIVHTARALLGSMEREQTFQRRWLALAERGLRENAWTGEGAAVTTYQYAETLRRLGEDDQAGIFYLQAAENVDLPTWIFHLTRERLVQDHDDLIGTETLDALWDAQRAGLITKLKDPERAKSAARTLRVLADPAMLPGIVSALTHESAVVRANAILALRDLPNPPDEVTETLCRILIDERGDAEENAAHALIKIGSPKSRGAFLKALDSENDSVVRTAVEGLGLVGGPEDIPVLVELNDIYPEHEREICRALARITNHDVASLSEFAVWWRTHGSESRGDWTRAGFADAGLDLTGLPREKLIPLLIKALENPSAPLRFNALRRLRKLTGKSIGWPDLAGFNTSERAQQERRMALLEWQRWGSVWIDDSEDDE